MSLPPTNRRFVLFDSLRALAVCGVLAVHIGGRSGANASAWYGVFTSHMNVGVTVFFLISGFLLYRPHVVAILTGAPTPSLKAYAWRRILRIVPAYWVALTLMNIWPGLPGDWAHDWWVYFGFAQSYRVRWLFGGITPAWSLSVEVAFYALLPAVAGAIAWFTRGLSPIRRMRRQLAMLAALGLASLAVRVVARATDARQTFLALFMWFAVGMALAVASVWWEGRERESRLVRLVVDHPGWCWLSAGLTFGTMSPLLARAFAPQTLLGYMIEHLLYALIALLLILPAVFGEEAGGFPRRVLAHAFPSWVGMISYSIFLWHYPLLTTLVARGWSRVIPGFPFLSLTLAIAPLALGVAWVSYQLIERPAMRLKDWQ